tara:strand:+ start:187030 stop:187926 length:897 start_codon:yes stop_codon:yes gene_type:complete
MSTSVWHVLGAGAIGGLFASFMHENALPVTLILRQRSAARIGLTREGLAPHYRFAANVTAPADPQPIRHLLVTTKAYDVVTALTSIAHRLTPNAQVVLMVNGMGLAEQVRSRLPQIQLTLATTTEGAYTRAPLRIVHAGHGQTRIGQQGQGFAPQEIAEVVQAVPRCRWDADIDHALWHKLIINCAINPLTALHHCRNGALATDPHLTAKVEQLCEELAAVSLAAGYRDTAAGLRKDVMRVIANTADNRSSMLQDIDAGRCTEIESITGYLLQNARRYGVATPANQALYDAIRDKVRP